MRVSASTRETDANATPAPFAPGGTERPRHLSSHWVRLNGRPTRDVYNRHLAYVVRRWLCERRAHAGRARPRDRTPAARRLDELNGPSTVPGVSARDVGAAPSVPAELYPRPPANDRRQPQPKAAHDAVKAQDRAIKHQASDSRRVRQSARSANATSLCFGSATDLDLVFFIAPGPLTLDHSNAASTRAWRCGCKRCLLGPASLDCVVVCPASAKTVSSVSPRIGRTLSTARSLHLCVERSGHLRGAERDGSGGHDRAGGWRLVSRIYRTAFLWPEPSGCWVRWVGCLAKASTKGRARAALLLRLGVGRVLGATRRLLWKVLLHRLADAIKLIVFVAILAFVGTMRARAAAAHAAYRPWRASRSD